MNLLKALPYFIAVFLIISLVSGFYIFFADSESPPLTKGIFIYTFITAIFLAGILSLIYRKISVFIFDISEKYSNLEKLLLDLRDGTKNFYKEKRKFPRVRDGVSARVSDKKEEELIKVLDISYEGALLRTKHAFEPGEIFNLSIHLPLFPQPIHVRAKAVRVIPIESKTGENFFNVGIEILGITPSDKEKLIETVDVLGKNPHAIQP